MVALLFGVGLVVVGAGCGKEEAKDTGQAAGGIGVAECDDYVKKYEACLNKSSAPGKEQAMKGFKSQVDSFKTMAATPEGKATLKAQCKVALDNLPQNPFCK
jgi:hypothetical protein